MDEAIGHYPAEHKRSASLPLMHLWQEHFGFISDEAITWIAAKLELEPVHVLERDVLALDDVRRVAFSEPRAQCA